MQAPCFAAKVSCGRVVHFVIVGLPQKRAQPGRPTMTNGRRSEARASAASYQSSSKSLQAPVTTPQALARACSQSKSQSQTGTFKVLVLVLVLVVVLVLVLVLRPILIPQPLDLVVDCRRHHLPAHHRVGPLGRLLPAFEIRRLDHGEAAPLHLRDGVFVLLTHR